MTSLATCNKCSGTGWHMYDLNHIQPCESCCKHSDGWWQLDKRHGMDADKFACKTGCGTVIERLPDDDALLGLTRDALVDVLGREPTKQEILRAHAGFKRMAFHLYEHLKREEKKKE